MKKVLLACLVALFACKQKSTSLFTELSSSRTGIHFTNTITESDSINSIDMEFLYNGGGVAIGDFNSDNLPDIYFTASQLPNKLYINKGNLSFEDVSDEAGVSGNGEWSNGASIVDINADGLPDIYVCTSIKKTAAQRTNLLYINQGPDKKGIPVFREMAKEYRLADTNMSVHAAFFDYDNDGDLDMYLVNTKLAQRNSTRFDRNSDENKALLSDRFFRNDGIPAGTDHPVFTDVSAEAGIYDEGFGLGVAIADVNEDGWKDIYVTNDFFTSDLLYINQKDGTFKNEIASCLKHTSQNAMGIDIADVNNDGLPDIMSVDMNPEDNYRKKKNMGSNNYYVYQRMMQGDMMLQYVRNTLQLNNGSHRDTSGQLLPVYSDIGFYAGVAETDWSWSPLLADFDNDGFRDLFITNGYPRDVTDHDFAFFNSNYSSKVSKKELLAKIPQIKIPNYAYHNLGNLRFENSARSWGLDQASYSAGAAYADLDNDGDLDYVVNNINDEAFVYENHSETINAGNHFISIGFKGAGMNRNGIGATATIFYGNDQLQKMENSPYRGYLSCMNASVNFGLGNNNSIDSLVITWPGGKKQVLQRPVIDRRIIVDIANANLQATAADAGSSLFADITGSSRIALRHYETDYIDFDEQRLLPHKLSEYGPALCAGDIDGNGLDDLFAGAASGYDASLLLQQPDGTFRSRILSVADIPNARKPEIMGALLLDVDGDGDADLYTASGSNEAFAGSLNYQDRLFINDGKGNFHYDSVALPLNLDSKSCVKAVDFDRDGDLDLFVGGRSIPGKYPLPASSHILRNDSQNGKIKFTDITRTAAAGLQDLGLVCDATWSDYDNDGWMDLVIAGEWMPVTFFHNEKGRFVNATAQSGLAKETGWWNSIIAGDFDNDGDIDYVAGNLGENSFFRADSLHPASVYSSDFGKNGQSVVVPTVFLPGTNGQRQEFTVHNRDDIMNQLPGYKKKFLTYKSFADATIHDLFTDEEMQKAYRLSANYFKSALLENDGHGHFTLHALPPMAQLAPLNGMIAEDLNEDGFLDIIANGNDYGMEVASGRMDALDGLVLLGNGQNAFQVLSLQQSGVFIPGNGKALVKLRSAHNTYLVAATQNKGWLKLFAGNKDDKQLIPLPGDAREIWYTLKSGKMRKEEVYIGNSFLSQSARFVCMNGSIEKIEVVDGGGRRRVLKVGD
jgi:enediyne biosynthesis protein E4